MPVNSFTPEKQSPAFGGIISEVMNRVTYATAGNVTYKVSDIIGGFINRDTNGGARTDTFPTAAALVAGIEGAKVGSAIQIFIKNTAGAANSLTVAIGTGGTAVGTMTVAQSNIKSFLIIVTALGDQNNVGATYDLVSLGTAAF